MMVLLSRLDEWLYANEAIAFRVPRDPTAQVGLRLRRYSGKTPATPAPARKRCAHPHSAAEIVPALDCRRPPPGESSLSAFQPVAERDRGTHAGVCDCR